MGRHGKHNSSMRVNDADADGSNGSDGSDDSGGAAPASRFLGSIVLASLLGLSEDEDVGESLCKDKTLATDCPLMKNALSTSTDSDGTTRTVLSGDPIKYMDCWFRTEAQQKGVCNAN